MEKETDKSQKQHSLVRSTLQKFQDGYKACDFKKLDEFMQLYVQDGSSEMIDIGPSKRSEKEWFEVLDQVRTRFHRVVAGDLPATRIKHPQS